MPSAFEPFARATIVASRLPFDDLVEVDLVGLPVDERDASSGQVRFGDGAGPVVGPRVVSQVNGRRSPELRRGLCQSTGAVELAEQCARCRLQNGRSTIISCAEEPSIEKQQLARRIEQLCEESFSWDMHS